MIQDGQMSLRDGAAGGGKRRVCTASLSRSCGQIEIFKELNDVLSLAT
jgi:hypothetical protein